MDKNISLAQLADKLDYEAKMIDYCEVASVGVAYGEHGWDFVFFVKYPNGGEGEIRVPQLRERAGQ